jgi:gliding motility-associated protein GldM
MNVFYIGVDNPVTISAPGVPTDKVQPSISGGSLSGGNGKYIVRVTGGSKAVINVSANLEGGSRSMGSAEFRIKPLPTPVAYVAGRNGGNYSKAELLASPYVTAVLENFDFDLRYNVASYTFVYKNAAGDLIDIPGSGYVFNQNIKTIIQGARRGDRFWVDNIVAVGPTGNKNLGSVSIRITQ